MRYVLARHEEAQRREVYRIYVTDALQLAAENTAKAVGGRYITRRYGDVLTPQKVETRTGDEIKEHMKQVLGGLA